MPVLPPHIREQIRAASDIVEVIGASLPLKRAGTDFVALCPFHREKTPSFHVSPSKQMYYCFGCHKGGDVFRFLQDHDGLTFVEAARRLAERAGIRLEWEDSPAQREERAISDRLRELHEQIARRWQQALQTDAAGEAAREYLASRGVSQEAVELFRLGYAPEAWDDTLNWARAKGWDLALVEQAGLILPRDPADPSRGHYDRFRGRLMFPICDEQGRVIAFSGRILRGDDKAPKYVNSPESPIFTKGRVLYALDKSKRAILDAGAAIICEGQLDAIACFMAGVKNIVAPQGTALTGEHLRILRRYAQEVVLCFDSDTAGQKAAARALDEVLGSGLFVRVITVPAPHDPDSYIKAHGPEAFRALVGSARDFFEFYLEFLCAREPVQTDRGRQVVLQEMAAALGRTANEILLDRYAQRTAMALAAAGGVALSPDAVRAEFRKRIAASGRSAPRPRPAPEPAQEPRPAGAAPVAGLDPASGSENSRAAPTSGVAGGAMERRGRVPWRTRGGRSAQSGFRGHGRQPAHSQSGTAAIRRRAASAKRVAGSGDQNPVGASGSQRGGANRESPAFAGTPRGEARPSGGADEWVGAFPSGAREP
jgi:DNA primase